MESLDKLVKDLGNLRYDKLVGFIYELASELEKRDYSFRSWEIYVELGDTADALRKANIPLKRAWDICEPYMRGHCGQHSVDLGKPLYEVAKEVSSLGYDKLVGFVYDLADDLNKQANKDFFRGRKQLAACLLDTVDALRNVNVPLKRLCERYGNVRKEIKSDS
ncbi:MAG: hypothetical protein V1914_01625 [archaeon]